MAASTGTLTLLSTNDYAGTTTISGGTLQVGNGTTADGGIGTGEIDNYGTLILDSASSQAVLGVITGNGPIIKRGPGVTVLAGANVFGAGVTNQEGTLKTGNGSALGDTSYGTTINSGATLDLGGQNLVQEPIFASGTGVSGAGAIVDSGPLAGSLQSLTLSGPTTFGGSVSWTIAPASSVVTFQANSNKVTKIGSNNLQYANADSSYVADPGFGDVEVQAGRFSLYGSVGLGDPAKSITVRTNATLEIDNTGDSLTPKPIVLDDGATLASALPNRLLPQYCTVPGPITLGGTVTVNVVATDLVTVQGEVSGTGPLIKGNPGVLALGVSNSFTGDLLVQAGTVALVNDGSVTKSPNIVLSGTTFDASARVDGALTLASGQTLSGSGTVVGILNSPSGSTVSPGASMGTISVTGDTTLRGDTVMAISKAGSVLSGDQLAVTGLLDLGGTLKVTYSGDALQAGDTFVLFTAGAFNNEFTDVQLPSVTGVVWTNMTAIDGTVQVLSASVPTQPTVSSTVPLSDGTFQLNFSGPAGYGYSVRASDDINLPIGSWEVLNTGTFGSSPVSFIDMDAPNHQNRFYVISIP